MPSVPSTLSRQAIARQVISRIQAIQEQALNLELIRIANDHTEAQEVPGSEPKREAGKIVYEDDRPVYPTYGEQQATLQAAAARIMGRATELGVQPLVEAIVLAEHEEGPAL